MKNNDYSGEDLATVLHAAHVPMYNHTVCATTANDEEYYENITKYDFFSNLPFYLLKKHWIFNEYCIASASLCVGYPQGEIGFCRGDHGGPLLCQNNDGNSVLEIRFIASSSPTRTCTSLRSVCNKWR